MRIKEALTIGVLGAGVPLLLTAATLYSRAECQIDPSAKVVRPIGYRSELQWLFVIVGVGQTALIWQLVQELRSGNDEAEAEPGSPPALPEAIAPAMPDFGAPVIVKAALEPVPVPVAAQPATPTTAAPTTVIYRPQHSQPVAQSPPQSNQPPQPPSLIKSLAASHLSIVFSAPPGTGKTTTELAWMGHVFHQFPDALMFVACWKNDAFLGLSSLPGAVAVLGDVDVDGNLDWQPLLRQVNKVFAVLRYRRNLPQENRSEFEGKPVWLVLADYYATVNTLSQSKKYLPVWEEVRTKLATIITVGREFQVGACVDTHSFNIASLGISDANIRDCLNICALGKITRTEDGREDGGYGAIAKAIGNKFVVDNEAIRTQLLTRDLPQLQKRSEETGRPVLFTTLGHPPKLVLLPDYRQYETFKLPPHALERIAQNMGMQIEPTRNEKLDLRNQLEMLYQEDSSSTDLTPKSFRTDSETPPEIDFDRVLRVFEMRNAGLSQTQILAIEWGAKPGDNLPYKTAVAEYKAILKLLEQKDH